MKKILFAFSALFLLLTTQAAAQCTHDPRVTGDTLLCPNEGGMLTTQAADSYQWYKREYGTSTTTLITGETNQSIVLTSNDVLFYFSVDAVVAGCTERSPEVLVDGMLFLLPFVQSTGDFTVGGSGEAIICTGDTMYLTLGLPYDTLITWFDNGSPIPGADGQTLTVTTAGSYTCQGAPSICPNFLQSLGVTVEVVEQNCGVGVPEVEQMPFSIFPNPAHDQVRIQLTDGIAESIEVVNAVGQTVLRSTDQTLDIQALAPGCYLLRVQSEGKWSARKFLID